MNIACIFNDTRVWNCSSEMKRFFVLCLFGYGMMDASASFYAGLSLTRFGAHELPIGLPLSSLVAGLALVIGVLAFSKCDRLLASRSFMAAMTLAECIAVLLRSFGVGLPGSETALFFADGLHGLFLALFGLGWLASFSRMGPLLALIGLAFGCLVGSTVYMLVLPFPVWAHGVAAFLAPLATAVLWDASQFCRGIASCATGASATGPAPWRLIVAFCAVCLVTAFLNTAVSSSDSLNLAGGVLLALTLAVAGAVLRESFPWRAVNVGSMSLIAVGAMLVLVPSLPPFLGSKPLVYTGYLAFAITCTSAVCAWAHAAGERGLRVLAAMLAGSNVSFALGASLGLLMGAFPGLQSDLPLCAMASIVVLVVSFSLMIADRAYGSLWSCALVAAGTAPCEGAVSVSGQEDRCGTLARTCDLTLREEEVLRLFAEGRTSKAIAAELTVSESTAKTHIRHIYRKAGVTKKSELMRRLRSL